MALRLPDWARNTTYRCLHALAGDEDPIRVILLYHSIGDDSPHSLPLEAFEQQLDLLSKEFTFTRIDALRNTLESSDGPSHVVAITFDDGFLDNYRLALPALERRGIPATFFVATGSLGGHFGTSAGALPMMDREQVRALSDRGHEIGAHTVTHPKLTQVSPETAREEMDASRIYLEELIGKRVVSFAYPKGNYDAGVRDITASLGFDVAVTTEEGLVPAEPDWLALPRVWVSNRLSQGAFRAKLSRAAGWYATLEQRVSRLSRLGG